MMGARGKRLQAILFLSTGMATMAAIAVATVNPLVAAGLTGAAAAGIPAAAILIGQASSSYMWGRVTQASGWRRALTVGLALGGLGLVLSAFGVVRSAPAAFLGGLFFAGTAYAVVTLSRFAAGEMVGPEKRARSISLVVLGGTLGAVFGPLLVAPLSRWSSGALGIELAGPYVGGALLLGISAVLVFAGLRPDPRQLAEGATPGGEPVVQSQKRLAEIFARPGIQLGTLTMVVGQLVMVMLMVITSLHMRDHGHALTGIAAVITAHTFGMYAFSAVSGRLADRWGRRPVIVVGAATLLASALLAPLSPRLVPLSVSLFLLGFGWNFCFVGGSALFSDHLLSGEGGRAQGVNDLLVNTASAVGSLASGVIFVASGYLAMALLGAGLALIPLLIAWRQRNTLAGVAASARA
jgi:MFS family permease